jgi:hypothetical protein
MTMIPAGDSREAAGRLVATMMDFFGAGGRTVQTAKEHCTPQAAFPKGVAW